MYQAFINRIPQPSDYYIELFKNATIIVDTNVLLNMYRYSEATADYFLKTLKSIQNRVWIPYQVGNEFFQNRKKIIISQSNSYNEIESKIKNIVSTFEDSQQHPFISKESTELLSKTLETIYTDLSSSKEKYNSLLESDPILDKILGIYQGNIGQPYSEDDLEKIISEGKERYKNKIPPGYMDSAKEVKDLEKNPSPNFYERVKPYGDYIIWRQIIDFALKGKDVLFITQDVKEDWFEIQSNRKLGPRHELLDEFTNITGKKIHFYQTDIFLERLTKTLGKFTDDAAIEEVKNNAKSEYKINIHYNKEIFDFNSKIETYYKNNFYSVLHNDSSNPLLVVLNNLENKIDSLIDAVTDQSKSDASLFDEVKKDINTLILLKDKLKLQTMIFISNSDNETLKKITQLIDEIYVIFKRCENKLL